MSFATNRQDGNRLTKNRLKYVLFFSFRENHLFPELDIGPLDVLGSFS